MTLLCKSRFLCVSVPEFAAQARLRSRPDLRAKAIAILDGVPPLQVVCSTTRRAREIGVRCSLTRAELDSFPDVQLLLRSEPEERNAAVALLATLWNFSPRIQVLDARAGSHRLVLDIAGTERIFGPPARLAHTVLREVRSLGLSAHLAVSDNFHAAVCAAYNGGPMPRIIAPGCEREALAPLPIAVLDALTQEQEAIFAVWGLHTLGEIAALPEAQLISRMGQAAKRLWLLARGIHPHLLEPEEECFTLEERTEFDNAVEVLDSLLFVLGPMLEHLVLRAAGRALALASVTVRLDLTSHAEASSVAAQSTTYTRKIQPALPLADSRVLLRLLQLELQAHPPGSPVISVRLEAEAGDRARAQLGLFSPQLPEPSRLEVTLARIRALVGEGRVGCPKLLDAHQPDSFVVEPFAIYAGNAHTRSSASAATSSGSSQTCTAHCGLSLKRLRPPVPLRMRVAAEQPKFFFFKNVRYEVTAAYGPWQQSGNWWNNSAWSCEEWDVSATANGEPTLQCRIAHDLLHEQWQMEGLYD